MSERPFLKYPTRSVLDDDIRDIASASRKSSGKSSSKESRKSSGKSRKQSFDKIVSIKSISDIKC